jgi:apocytochrome f
MKRTLLSQLTQRGLQCLLVVTLLVGGLLWPQTAHAYPFYAQQGFENPREPTGRIVCANCHLAAKPTEVEVPHSVLPDTVFKAVVKAPYDHQAQQVLGDGSPGPLNVGALVVLPEGFSLAPAERISEKLKEEIGDLYIQPYSETRPNILLVGPVPGDSHEELVFPILSPDPATDKSVHFGKYLINVGANRGRGQVQPTGDKTNNNLFTAPIGGTVTEVSASEAGGAVITIKGEDGNTVSETIPAGPQILVSQGQQVAAGAALTSNPNVGGFGQHDAEIVLQDSRRVAWLIVFFVGIMLSQTMLVLKKKQIEKVQAAEMNF